MKSPTEYVVQTKSGDLNINIFQPTVMQRLGCERDAILGFLPVVYWVSICTVINTAAVAPAEINVYFDSAHSGTLPTGSARVSFACKQPWVARMCWGMFLN